MVGSYNGFISFSQRRWCTAFSILIALTSRRNLSPDFRKDGATVGNIRVIHGNNLTVGSAAAGHIGLQFGTGIIYPTDNTGTANDNAVALGDTNQRFTNLYLSGSVSTGSTTTLTETAGGDTQLTNTNTGADVFLVSGRRLRFNTAGSERARIDSSGNLLVGKTALNTNTAGLQLENDGYLSACRDGGNVVLVNRKSSDGALVTLQKDGTTVGSIGARGGDVYLETGAVGLRMYDAGSAIFPSGNTGISQDALITLGASNYRFKDLYLSGGVYLGGTGAANKLDDYETGTWTPVAVNYTGTLSNVRGSYVKIGKKVFIDLYCSTSDDSSTTAVFSISGLPFASDSTSGAYSTFSIMSYNNPAGTAVAGCQVPPSSSSIRMLKKTSATSPTWADWQGQDVNLGEINVSFSYSVA